MFVLPRHRFWQRIDLCVVFAPDGFKFNKIMMSFHSLRQDPEFIKVQIVAGILV